MNRYKYLIIGGGMTADAAVRGVREIDPEGTIGMVSMEDTPPYDRPPLSKSLWKGKSIDRIWRSTTDFQVSLSLGREITELNAETGLARDDQGVEYYGEKILIASGGTPRRLRFGGNQILFYRTIADYRRLSDMAAEKEVFTVIGGGFIGWEIAAALRLNGKKVNLIFPEEGIGGRIFPVNLTRYLNKFYRKKGVDVFTGESVTDAFSSDSHTILETKSGRKIETDGVIAGVGIVLNTGLAKNAGLNIGKGIIVDENLATSHANIYAAGDVAEFFNPALGKYIQVEHEDNANRMGLQAGRNMAGKAEPYHHLPFFYSDLFELGFEAVGELDAQMITVADWANPFQKGIIYYFWQERVRGVLLWNVWNKVSAAQELIAQTGPFFPEDLRKEKPADWKIIYE